MSSNNKKDIFLILTLTAFAVLSFSCLGDPFPEPDADRKTEAGDDEYDIDTDGEGPAENSGTDKSDGETDSIVDNETDIPPDGNLERNQILRERLFVSAPDTAGNVIVAALPGAVIEATSAKCTIGSNEFPIMIGKDRGFALNVTASIGETLTVTLYAGQNSAVVSIPITEDPDATSRTWPGLAGESSVVNEIGAYLHVSGSGPQLAENTFVIAANLSNSNAAIGQIICEESAENCRFDLMVDGNLLNEIKIFMVSSIDRTPTTFVTVPIPNQ